MARVKQEHVVCRAQRVFYVLGLRRSGNHAFCNWLGCAAAPALFCNNGHLWPTDLIEKGVTWSLRKKETVQRLESLPEFGSIIYGLENFYPSQLKKRYAVVRRSYHGCLSEKDLDSKTIFLLRDPFNTFASILRHNTQGKDSFCLYANGQFAGRWTNVARSFLCADGRRSIGVDYNMWAIDQSYREAICAMLGLEFTDVGFDHVPAFGHGSSFSRIRQMTDVERQKLNTRYEELLSNENEAYQLWLATDSWAFWWTANRMYPALATYVREQLAKMEKRYRWKYRYASELGQLP